MLLKRRFGILIENCLQYTNTINIYTHLYLFLLEKCTLKSLAACQKLYTYIHFNIIIIKYWISIIVQLIFQHLYPFFWNIWHNSYDLNTLYKVYNTNPFLCILWFNNVRVLLYFIIHKCVGGIMLKNYLKNWKLPIAFFYIWTKVVFKWTMMLLRMFV